MEPEHRLIQERINKIKELRSWKVEPYPYSFEKKNEIGDVVSKFDKIKKEEKTKTKVQIAGRIMRKRDMGKIMFLDVQDWSGRIQLVAKKDDVKEDYKVLKKLDIGDYLGASGIVFKTKMGELSVEVKDFSLLCKSIRPLPEKWHGLKDVEERYRKRSVDMIVNPEVRNVLVMRHEIIKAVREYMNSKGFVEIEIPTLQPIYGGAGAKPFKTHINAWDMDLFMSISPELYLKRLAVGGIEKVYSICKNFRNEGVDKTHNPEFTMMEWYEAYVDYNKGMERFEEIYEYVSKKVLGKTVIEYQGKKIDFKRPWKRMTMIDAIKKFGELDVSKMSDDELLDKCLGLGVEGVNKKTSRGWLIAYLFEELCEEKLVQPVHITDHPKETIPLCKGKRGNEALIERFEPYIFGMEIGNGYSELNDPVLQRKLLEEQSKSGRGGGEEEHPMDEDFVQAIETGMAPTGGVGLGIDRMVMLFTNSSSIRDVIAFPTMKPVDE